MAFNGAGVFQRVHNWVADKAANIKITASRMDTEMDGFATGLSNCVTKDGQTNPTADLPMSSQKHTGVANADARDQYGAVGQIQDSAYLYAAVSGTDTYTMNLSPAITAYAAGQSFVGLVTNANTGAATLNVNSVGAKNILDVGGSALVAGDIPANSIISVVYDGTQFILLTATVDFATNAQANAGTATNAAITPANLEELFKGSGGTNLARLRPRTLIEEINASSASTVDFTSGIAGFDYYEIFWDNVLGSGSAVNMFWRTGDGSIDTSAIYSIVGSTNQTSAVVGTVSSSGNSSGYMLIYAAHDTSNHKPFHFKNIFTGTVTLADSGGYYASTSNDLDRFQFRATSGTLTGTFRLYGVYA